MEQKAALAALAALAHETRLAVFRLLVPVGPSGLAAGDIAERVGVVASTLSFHLKELDRAGVVRSWRRQRQVFYAADYEGTRRLLAFLTLDCCQGHPEICGYSFGAGGCDDRDLSEPGLSDLPKRAREDPDQRRRKIEDPQIPEDAAEPR